MILITCVDDDLGMLFNHRRQSQDRILREHILELTDGGCLWMNHYTEKQFSDMITPQINVGDNYLNEAAPGDYCFVEDASVLPYEKWVEKIILYKWNRSYPADFYFDIPLEEHSWKLIQTTDFTGSSHEKITEEVYER